MNPIEKLLNNYFSGSITSLEFTRLREIVASMNNRELSALLEEHWLRFEKRGEKPVSSFVDLSRKLGVPVSGLSKSKRGFPALTLWRVAVVVLLVSLSGTSIYLAQRNEALNSFQAQQMVVTVNSGERAKVTLPDGTLVNLNVATTLNYPVHFGFGKREVSLSGEAYFTVAKNRLCPFVVKTPYLDIEALGTAFNVYAYDSETWVEASLAEGSVKISTKGDNRQTLRLKPNEKAVYNKQTGKLGHAATDLRFETAWVNGELIFRSASFDELLVRLGRCYGMEFDVEGDTSDFKRYTGTFNADDVVGVLELLKFHYPILYKIKENRALLVVTK